MIRELTVSGEVLVIPVFSKLLGLVTCEGSGLSQSATQLWPSIFAGLCCSLEDLVQEKVRKEYPCVVSSSAARCTTLRDEECVFLGENADNVLRDLSHADAWDHCVTAHYDNMTATRLRNNCA